MVALARLPAAVVAGWLLVGCAGPAQERLPRPEVAVVRALPPGAELLPTSTVPDELPWRAALPLWREALGQSATFEVVRHEAARGTGLRLELTAEPSTQRLAAILIDGEQRTPVAGGQVVGADLGGAIDRLARIAREALGEVTATPVATASAVGQEPGLVDAIADAELLLADGAIQPAARLFARSRARDGGSPAVLDGMALCALLLGRPAEAARIAEEALGYTSRLTPTRQHRLARTLLLARASLRPSQAPERDRELRELAQVFLRERPYDVEGTLSLGIAANFLADFATARTALSEATRRDPGRALAWYHLGWAELGLGNAKAGVAAFDRAAPRLPAAARIVPQAIALFAAGDHERLARELAELASDYAAEDQGALHDVRRMQAAHALLRGQDGEARALLQADFAWLAAHPSVLETRGGEVAEAGMVLIRLGGGSDLLPTLAALQQQRPEPAVADAIAFLSGLLEVERTGERAAAAERQLGRGGDSVFGLLLQAYAHERRGELADRYVAVSRAARSADSPLIKAMLAQCLRAMGKTEEADNLRKALRDEMLQTRLRERARHPLLGPELAYAFR